MQATHPNSKVDFYFKKAGKWQAETEHLRLLMLNCGLTEELKWGVPCYNYNGSNIVLMHIFKDYCALLFFKGVLMNDVSNILVQQTENVQSARQLRFTNLEQIISMENTIKAYVLEAVEIEKSGLTVNFKDTSQFNMPVEFQTKLTEQPELKTAFENLTPGRQRGYLLYFSAAKLTKTREQRITKYIPQILIGKGLDD